MMSAIWILALGASLVLGLMSGSADLGAAAAAGAKKAVELSLAMAGGLCLWSGFAELLERSGLQAGLARLLAPVLGRLFPSAAKDRRILEPLCGNVTANLLGLGNAATPLGVEAVRRMQARSKTAGATDEMCRLIVLNTASIQLLPTTVAALRGGLGAAAPFDILPAVWASSVLSVSAGLLAAELLRRLWQ